MSIIYKVLDDLEAEKKRLTADLRHAEGAIAAHNSSCQDACGHGDLEADRCGWRPYFAFNGRRCPTCPVHDIIDYKRLSEQKP